MPEAGFEIHGTAEVGERLPGALETRGVRAADKARAVVRGGRLDPKLLRHRLNPR